MKKLKMFSNYLVLDMETSGLKPGINGRIISISALKIKGNKVEDHYFSYLNPGITLDKFVTEITGVSNEVISRAPDISDELFRFIQFTEELPLVTHHGEFEKSFLLNELLLCDVQFKPKFICTRQICKDLYPYILGTTADKIIQQLGIQSMHDEASPSFVDVYRTYAIFQRIMSDLMSLGQANTYDYYI